MSVVEVIEGLAWLISAGLACWMVVDMVRTARTNDEQALVDAPDPLDEFPADPAPAPASSPGVDGPTPGRAS